MRLSPRSGLLLLGICLVVLTGCQRLDYESEFKLQQGITVEKLSLDPPKYKQNLTVTLTSSDKPLWACIVKTDDLDAAVKAIESKKEPSVALAYQAESKNITLNATIVAGTGPSIVFLSEGQTTVKVKIKGR